MKKLFFLSLILITFSSFSYPILKNENHHKVYLKNSNLRPLRIILTHYYVGTTEPWGQGCRVYFTGEILLCEDGEYWVTGNYEFECYSYQVRMSSIVNKEMTAIINSNFEFENPEHESAELIDLMNNWTLELVNNNVID